MIDVVAIFPFDLFFQQGDFSSLVRLSRVSKLYRIFKMVRLVRILKIVREKGKFVRYLGEFLRISVAFE